ncbi:MAG: quinone oxidoreductase [Chloroflexota bacterium]|nr:quinone oxidoreductase [Chloroflexota bacterium]
MKLIRFHTAGAPDVLRYEDAPIPTPAAGQVLVKVAAIGVNMIETYQRAGRYTVPLPKTPGTEAAGIVEAVGAGVTDFRSGDRVGSARFQDAYAEYALVPAGELVAVPDALDLERAAAALLQGMTAHYLTHATYPLQPGETALVHAAAGGTGQLVVQMAKRRGARVLATVGSEAKAQIARALGADEVILYREQDFEQEVKRLTDGRGVQVVYDSVGADTFEKSLRSLARRGMLVLFGAASGVVPPFDLQRLNALGSLYVTRPSLHDYNATRDEILMRAGEVFDWLADGSLRLTIDRTFRLSEAAAAHTALEGRESMGKFLLVP